MPRRPNHHAFTLLELVLVMVVICTVLAIAAPSMRGWNQGNKLKDAATEFIALTKLARTMEPRTSGWPEPVGRGVGQPGPVTPPRSRTVWIVSASSAVLSSR